MLDPALKQINDDPLGAGFSVEYEPIRKGRFYHKINFILTKTPQRIQQERNIKSAKSQKMRLADLKAKGRPALTSAMIARADQETRHTLDMGEIERQFWAHWEAKGKQDLKNVGGAFMGFVKGKYRQSIGR